MTPVRFKQPEHRSRLLSITSIDHRTEHPTWRLIPQASWERAQQDHANRWLYSFSITSAWEFKDLPSAKTLAPRAYRSLGEHENFGNIVELEADERDATFNESVTPVLLEHQPATIKANSRARCISAGKALREEIRRMATRITQRALSNDTTVNRYYREREANPPMAIQQLLYDKWEEQQRHSRLCQRPIPMPPAPGLLQPSPDRQDSNNPRYDEANLHVTHLGCNYEKNPYTIDGYDESLATITGNVHRRPSTNEDKHTQTAIRREGDQLETTRV